jgi:ribose-phosphate pyrophosphokinase
MPGIRSASISAASTLSAALDWSARPLLVGPDGESRQWVKAIAAPFDFEVLIGAKQRRDDRQVEIEFPDIDRAAGRHVVLVDDMISTGETLIAAARLLREAGAAKVEVLATHCLACSEAVGRLHAAGISQIRATDTIPGPVGTIPIAPAIATELRRRGWLRKR